MRKDKRSEVWRTACMHMRRLKGEYAAMTEKKKEERQSAPEDAAVKGAAAEHLGAPEGAATKSAAAERKHRGRPRRNGSQSGNPRTEIIDAAMKLFAQKGYANTNMSSIARAAGLDQSSLYYWFSNKEDILKHMLESNRASTRMAAGMHEAPGSKAAQLYAVLYADTKQLCEFPFDYYDLEAVAFEQRESFGEFFADYDELMGQVQRIIEEGVAAGEFHCSNAQRAASMALAANEGIQHRHHRMVAMSGNAYENAKGAARGGAGKGEAAAQGAAGERALPAPLTSAQVAAYAAEKSLAQLLAGASLENVRDEFQSTFGEEA